MSASAMASGGQRSNGPYFLHIEGLPKRFTWQDLKDLIRQQAAHGVWTEMAVYANGSAAGTGHARVQRTDEAIRLYKYLTEGRHEGRQLKVHLWDITAMPAQFKACNCEAGSPTHPPNIGSQGTRFFQMAMASDWQRVMPPSPMADPRAYPIPPMSNYPSSQVVNAMPAPMQPLPQQQPTQEQIIAAMSAMGLNPRDPVHIGQFRQGYLRQQQQQMVPMNTRPSVYTGNAAGLPVNVRQGTIRTEARGVFVSGLNYRASEKDIKAHFCEAGQIVKVADLRMDASTKKSKGNCTIQYTSAAEAQKAIELFHKKEFMSMRLNVREDKSRVAIDAPPTSTANSPPSRSLAGPIIVNGSQVRC
ncbi:hypothetical protein SMMN14_08098 [Sphaerulina musiva]